MYTSANCMMLAIWSLDDRSNFISPTHSTIVRNATSIS
jgi:predicted component of type VI protein secretion system